MKYNKAFCVNSIADKDGNVKVILTLDYLNKGICVSESEIENIEKIAGAYRIPHSGFFTDYFSYKSLLTDKERFLYVAIPTNVVVDINNAKVPVYTLQYLPQRDVSLFINGELTQKRLIKRYKPPKVLGEGGFGEVIYYPHQNFVAKEFAEWNINEQIPEDMVKEIAIYSLFAGNDCLTKMKGMDLNKGLLFFSRGISTLRSAYMTFTPEDIRKTFFQLVVCMRNIANQGIVHADLKPSNIVLDEKDVLE